MKKSSQRATAAKKAEAIRRAEAIKRSRRKRLIVALTGVLLLAAAVVVLLVVNAGRPREVRVFVDGQQTVALLTDRTFEAWLAHETKTGTYTEKTEAGVTTVFFVAEGITVNGSIQDDVLALPDEWTDDHGHGTELWLRKE